MQYTTKWNAHQFTAYTPTGFILSLLTPILQKWTTGYLPKSYPIRLKSNSSQPHIGLLALAIIVIFIGFQQFKINSVDSLSNSFFQLKSNSATISLNGEISKSIFNNSLYIFSTSSSTDVWKSDDGINYIQLTANAPWTARIGPYTLVNNNSIYLMGGTTCCQLFNDVWKSSNGINWNLLLNAPWNPQDRGGYLLVNGNLTIITGHNGGTAGDVWTSNNGIDWSLKSIIPGFSPASYRMDFSYVVSPNQSVLLSGGSNGYGTYYYDVWRSLDGCTSWIRILDIAPFLVGGRESHSMVLAPHNPNYIYVLGGTDSFSTNLFDLWYSNDLGSSWVSLSNSFNWNTGPALIVVFRDELLAISGTTVYNFGRFSNLGYSVNATCNYIYLFGFMPSTSQVLVAVCKHSGEWAIIPTISLVSSLNPSTFGASITFTAKITSGTTGSVHFKDGASIIGSGIISSIPNFNWSSNGTIPGSCIRIWEPADLNSWDNNFLCSNNYDLSQWQWSNAGPINGLQCIQWFEPNDPDTWNDNFLCRPNNDMFNYTWINSVYLGSVSGMNCIQTNEPAEPNIHTWFDNWWCISNTFTTATYTTNLLSGGSHSITAVYSGDTNYTTVNSSILTQVVNKASLFLSLVSSNNQSLYNTTITFIASIINAPVATGTVAFKNGSTTITTASIQGSTANFTTTQLPTGTYSINAVYLGDSNYNSASSPTISQIVFNPLYSLGYPIQAPQLNGTIISNSGLLISPPTGGSGLYRYSINSITQSGLLFDTSTGTIQGTYRLPNNITTVYTVYYTITITDILYISSIPFSLSLAITVYPSLIVIGYSIDYQSILINTIIAPLQPQSITGGSGNYLFTSTPSIQSLTGLSFNNATGGITGTTSVQSSDTTFTITVQDVIYSLSTSWTIRLLVYKPCLPIQLTSGQTNCSVSSTYPLKAICDFTCNINYALVYSSRVSCSLSGQWEPIQSATPQCYPSNTAQAINNRLLSYISVSSISPLVIPSQGATVQLSGASLSVITRIEIDGIAITNLILNDPNVQPLQSYDGHTQSLTFQAPAMNQNNTGKYADMTIYTSLPQPNNIIYCPAYPNPGQTIHQFCPAPSNTLYYSSVAIIPNQVCLTTSNTSCQACPANAVCPGGNLVYSNPGFYVPPNTNPNSVPGVYTCDDPTLERCSGGRPGSRSMCFDGYSSTICNRCVDGYYALNGICLPCSGSDGQPQILSITFLLFIYFAILGISIIYCSDKWLERFTLLVITTQQILAVGESIYIRFNTGLRKFYNYLRIFRLDFSYVRTDCNAQNSQVDYPNRFFISLAILTAIFIFFYIMALVYQYRKAKRLFFNESRQNPQLKWIPYEWLKNPRHPRVFRGLVFAVVITYVQFSTIILSIINCKEYPVFAVSPDSSSATLRMVLEKSTVCYSGSHLGSGILSWILLFFFIVGLPVFFLYHLIKGYKQNLLATKEFIKQWGFLYRRTKPNFYWYRSTNFFYSFISAIQLALLPQDTYIQIPILLSVAGFDFLILALLQPFLTRIELTLPLFIDTSKFFGSGVLFLFAGKIAPGIILVLGSTAIILYLIYFYIKHNLARRKAKKLENKLEDLNSIFGVKITDTNGVELGKTSKHRNNYSVSNSDWEEIQHSKSYKDNPIGGTQLISPADSIAEENDELEVQSVKPESA